MAHAEAAVVRPLGFQLRSPPPPAQAVAVLSSAASAGVAQPDGTNVEISPAHGYPEHDLGDAVGSFGRRVTRRHALGRKMTPFRLEMEKTRTR
jgi:hypothetical protein